MRGVVIKLLNAIGKHSVFFHFVLFFRLQPPRHVGSLAQEENDCCAVDRRQSGCLYPGDSSGDGARTESRSLDNHNGQEVRKLATCHLREFRSSLTTVLSLSRVAWLCVQRRGLARGVAPDYCGEQCLSCSRV